MKNTILFFLAFLFIISCGKIEINNLYERGTNTFSGLISPDSVIKVFANSEFNELEIGANIETNIAFGNSYKIVMQGDAQDINDLFVSQKGKILTISYSNPKVNRYKMFANITLPTINRLLLYEASITRLSKFPKIENIEIDLSQASIIELSGNCANLKAKISGASIFNGLEFNTEVVQADVSSASIFRIRVSKGLTVTAKDASKIEYIGNPLLESSILGASTITKL